MDEKVVRGLRALLSTWQEGRKTLVVLGAGASVQADIPLMTSVHSTLRDRVEPLVKDVKFSNNEQQLAGDLHMWLSALAKGEAPRSLAAMSLGMLQKAHERSLNSDSANFFRRLNAIWHEFSRDFTLGKVANPKSSSSAGTTRASLSAGWKNTLAQHPFAANLKAAIPPVVGTPRTDGPLIHRTPTKLHCLLARWAEMGWANLVSLNFDGLTQKAARLALQQSTSKGACVVLTEPRSIKSHYLGDSLPVGESETYPTRLLPVVKVWGDVFHEVCTNSRCPEAGARVPIFQLSHRPINPGDSQLPPDINQCPSCLRPRQLEIYFTGYEEKESKTQELMRELLRFLAPQVGSVVTVGFSGLWDQALIDFLSVVCTDLEEEHAMLRKEACSCICIDPEDNPPILQALAKKKISPAHFKMSGEAFASLFDLNGITVPQTERIDLTRYAGDQKLPDEQLWGPWVHALNKAEKIRLPQAYAILAGQVNYLESFRYARQLGIKTKICLATVPNPPKPGTLENKEQEHNRLAHTRGAAHLAMRWYHHLVTSLPRELKLPNAERERLASVVLFAAAHHDLGHLPFTHLTEEVYEELHWSLRDWGGIFRHDEPVVISPYDGFRSDIEKTFCAASQQLHVNPAEFRYWVENAIQARSGYPWIDALLNSPLDVDKLDYVFRDCEYLQQYLHFSKTEKTTWIENLVSSTRILPSGFILLEDTAGEHARDFFEERRWLYKHQYFQTGYRALERLARSLVVAWLVRHVSQNVVKEERNCLSGKPFAKTVNDVSCWKGVVARSLLWKHLDKGGEPKLLIAMATELGESTKAGLPGCRASQEWATRCRSILEDAFKWRPEDSWPTLEFYLEHKVGITCSDSFYVPFENLDRVREIIRQIETQKPFHALFDVAVFPRVLSYPSRRRLRWCGKTVLGECFAVSHYDPDRWGKRTGQWIPLSESAMAEGDKQRWAKISVVSPWADDPYVGHVVDRFRCSCRDEGIHILDVDPDEANYHITTD